MEIRHLLYFTEVARTRNFSAAAETLFVTQPTISKMIRNLEAELGVVLFNRRTKNVELTDAGRAMLKPSQDIVRAFRSLRDDLDDVANLRTGCVRIGMPPMAGASYFSRIIGDFSKLYPRIDIQLIEVGSFRVEQGVLEGALDLGIVMLPLEDARLDRFDFVREPVVVITGPDHPLKDRQSVDLEELSGDRFILFRKDFALHDQVLEQCRLRGFTPQIACQTSQWDFMVGMVAEDLGVGFIPRKVWEMNSGAQVHCLNLNGSPLIWHLAVIWESGRHLSYAARRWLSFARESLGISAVQETQHDSH